MFYYLVQKLPWGVDLEPNKRIIRAIIISSIGYSLLYAILLNAKICSNPMFFTVFQIIRKYFFFVLMTDIILTISLAILSHGRNFLYQLPFPQALKELLGFTEENGQQTIPQTIQQTIQHKVDPIIINQNQSTQKNLSQSTSSPKLIQSGIKNQNENELDIDLLTENESQPDENTNNNIQQTNKNNDNDENLINDNDENLIDNDENLIDESLNSETNSTISTNQSNNENNTSEYEIQTENDILTEPTSIEEGPKLTPENINKYVINRSKLKIKTNEVDIKSEDLKL